MKSPRSIVIALSIFLTACSAFAQGKYPEQPVHILVGFTPGVAPDVAARLLADKLAEALGKPVVVENIGADAIGGTPAELAAVIERELPQWAKVIKAAGIKASE